MSLKTNITGKTGKVTRNDGHLNSFYKTSDVSPSLARLNATGGVTATPGNGYKYHIFTHPDVPLAPSPDTFTVSPATSGFADILIVSGGGGGGTGYYGGGGGGGAVVYGQGVLLNAGTYPITIGHGGAGGPFPGTTPATGTNGGDSSFDGVISLGSGGGGAGPGGGGPGKNGGNAGGGSAYTQSGISSSITIPGGYSGNGTWTVYQNVRPAAATIYGGDGAGGPGTADASGVQNGGNGVPISAFAGPLIPSLTPNIPAMGPTGDYYGGGGGGYAHPAPTTGGFGGGQTGSPGNVTPNGLNTRLGGGGGGSGNPRGNGGKGGTGIVIIRYLDA